MIQNKKITIQPLFEYRNLFKRVKVDKEPSVSNNIYFKSGRIALKFILDEIINNYKVKKIYIPYLICSEVIDILQTCNIQIFYYGINQNLTVNESLNKADICEHTVVLFVNYFGLKDNSLFFKKIKEKRNCLLIEDNAHTLNNDDMEFVDFSFNSLRKLLPILSGSLISSTKTYSQSVQRIRPPSFLEIKYFLRGLFSKKLKHNLEIVDKDSNDLVIETEFIDYISHYVLTNNKFNYKAMREQRISNYNHWSNFLSSSDLTLIKDIDLNSKTFPYMFPCYADNHIIREKWIKWGLENNITIIPWPKFSKLTQIHDDSIYLKNILCFPVNHQFDLKKIIR